MYTCIYIYYRQSHVAVYTIDDASQNVIIVCGYPLVCCSPVITGGHLLGKEKKSMFLNFTMTTVVIIILKPIGLLDATWAIWICSTSFMSFCRYLTLLSLWFFTFWGLPQTIRYILGYSSANQMAISHIVIFYHSHVQTLNTRGTA